MPCCDWAWQQVRALSLEELSDQKDIDPMLALLSLPVRLNSDLLSAVLPIVVQRFNDQAKTCSTPALCATGSSRAGRKERPEASTAEIQGLPLEQLEALAEELLDFSGPADLAAWLEEHQG
jgi:hypothetical protein